MSAASSSTAAGAAHHRDRTWLVVLGAGITVWLLASFITWLTRDNILIPTVILTGSFLVPVSVMVWAMSLRRADELTPRVIFLGFLYDVLLGLNAVIGTWWVVHEYRRHTRRLVSGAARVVEFVSPSTSGASP